MLAYRRAMSVADPLRLAVWDERGLTMPQLRLMYLLLRDSRSVGELAEAMHVRPASVTGLTDRLVCQGLIERHADPDDRRVVRIALSAEGRCVLEEIESAGRSYLARIFELMGEDEVNRLSAALERFSDAANRLSAEAGRRL